MSYRVCRRLLETCSDTSVVTGSDLSGGHHCTRTPDIQLAQWEYYNTTKSFHVRHVYSYRMLSQFRLHNNILTSIMLYLHADCTLTVAKKKKLWNQRMWRISQYAMKTSQHKNIHSSIEQEMWKFYCNILNITPINLQIATEADGHMRVIKWKHFQAQTVWVGEWPGMPAYALWLVSAQLVTVPRLRFVWNHPVSQERVVINVYDIL
jgi:hypothetical protein